MFSILVYKYNELYNMKRVISTELDKTTISDIIR